MTQDEAQFELTKLNNLMIAIDNIVYVADPETYEILYLNQKAVETFGDCLGRQCFEALHDRETPCTYCNNDKIFGENLGKTNTWEIQSQFTGQWMKCMDRAIDWPDGRKVRFEIAIDITRQKEAEELIRRQTDEILELSTPVIQVWKGIVVAPLIGTLDSRRTQNFMERFLHGITETESPVALLDITGVPTVDTQTAQHFTEAIYAARLLGTKVILTGVRPAIAQTLVHLGVDLSDVETQASLAAGLKLALKLVGLRVVNN